MEGLEWFRDAKLGMFMHNGPVTQWGTEISFPLLCEKFPCVVKGPGNVAQTLNNTDDLKDRYSAYRLSLTLILTLNSRLIALPIGLSRRRTIRLTGTRQKS